MYMARSIQFLPYISFAVLLVALVFLEVKDYREQAKEEPEPEPGRNGFIAPPGDGYEYYVSGKNIVYILQKTKNRFRVYLELADTAPSAKLKHDRFGQYFTVRAADAGSAEHIVDAAFGM